MKRKNRLTVLAVIALLIYLILAIVLVAVTAVGSAYPSGSHTIFHLYRGDVIFRAVREGTLFPYYDAMWFNGTELLRFTPPLSGYILALFQMLAGGNILYGYLLFLGVLFYAGAMVWLTVGMRMERPLLGMFLGALCFFCPIICTCCLWREILHGVWGRPCCPGSFFR